MRTVPLGRAATITMIAMNGRPVVCAIERAMRGSVHASVATVPAVPRMGGMPPRWHHAGCPPSSVPRRRPATTLVVIPCLRAVWRGPQTIVARSRRWAIMILMMLRILRRQSTRRHAAHAWAVAMVIILRPVTTSTAMPICTAPLGTMKTRAMKSVSEISLSASIRVALTPEISIARSVTVEPTVPTRSRVHLRLRAHRPCPTTTAVAATPTTSAAAAVATVVAAEAVAASATAVPAAPTNSAATAVATVVAAEAVAAYAAAVAAAPTTSAVAAVATVVAAEAVAASATAVAAAPTTSAAAAVAIVVAAEAVAASAADCRVIM